MKLFNYEGGFWQFGEMLFDFVMFNCLMVFISFITFGLGIGATFSALVYGLQRNMFAKEGGVFRHFFKGIKTSWLQSTIIWFIGSLVIGANVYTFLVMYQLGNIVYVFNILIIIEAVMITVYALTITAIIKLPLREVYYYAIVLPHKHIFMTFLMLLTIIIIGVISLTVGNIFLLIFMSLFGYMANVLIINRVIMNYLSDEQKSLLE